MTNLDDLEESVIDYLWNIYEQRILSENWKTDLRDSACETNEQARDVHG